MNSGIIHSARSRGEASRVPKEVMRMARQMGIGSFTEIQVGIAICQTALCSSVCSYAWGHRKKQRTYGRRSMTCLAMTLRPTPIL